MCLSPVRIYTPKLKADTYISGCDRLMLNVPCGHCPECNDKRVRDLVFRCFHEFIDCSTHGGFTLFQTLTYSEENVPYSNGFRFFRKKDLQLFLKRVRMRLDRMGYVVSDGLLKYIITCEYGDSDTGTHRPHYHVEFFSKVVGLTPDILDRVIYDSWTNLGKRFVKDSKLGFVDRRSVEQRVVNSIYGIRYVCKYVFKGTLVKNALLYNKSSDITKFVRDFCRRYGRIYEKKDDDSWSWDNLKDWQIARIYNAYLQYFPEMKDYQLMPFYLSSKGLGMSFLENCSLDELLDVVKLPSKSSTGFADFAVPQYYIRKAFYNYDKDSKRYILNDLGREYKENIYKAQEDSLSDFLENNQNLYDSISLKLYGRKFSSLVDSYLAGRSIDDFVYYAVYLKDRAINPSLSFLFNSLYFPFELCVPVKDYALHFAEFQIQQEIADSPSWVVPSNISDIDINKCYHVVLPLHNTMDCFKGFDDLYNVLQKIKSLFVKSRNLMIAEKYEYENSKRLALSQVRIQNSVIF